MISLMFLPAFFVYQFNLLKKLSPASAPEISSIIGTCPRSFASDIEHFPKMLTERAKRLWTGTNVVLRF